MGITNYTSPGTYNWTAPSYVNTILGTCIGGGGSGLDDRGADNEGAGGGGGGFCRAIAPISAGQFVTIQVGAGGVSPGFFSSQGGQASIITNNAGSSIIAGGGGNILVDGAILAPGGDAAAPGCFNVTAFAGAVGLSDNAGDGLGGGAGTAFGTPTGYCPGSGGTGTDLDGNLTGCPALFDGNGSAYGGGGRGYQNGLLVGNGGNGAARIIWIDMSADKTTLRSGETANVTWSSPFESGSSTVSWGNNGATSITQTYTRTDIRGLQSTLTFTILPIARINSFTATPNPQTSGLDGVPNYDTSLSWSTTGATSASITDIGGVFVSGDTTVTNLPQSVAGSNSPAIKTYTLTASDGFNTSTSSITVSVYNDNTPDNFTIPDQINVEPSTLITIIFGPINGIDMRTSVTAGPGAEVSNNNINWSNTVSIQNNQSCYVRAFSPSFNTDPNGLTNSSTFSVTVGTLQKFFTLTTRAPDVNETFNLSNKEDYVPSPDIDTIPDPDADITNQANPYIVSDTLLIDDVELANPNGVEIKVDNHNAQVRVKRLGQSTFGPWQDVRSI